MQKILLDIEVYPNCFLLGYKDYITKEGEILEISKYKNDLKLIVDFCKSFEGFVITFNGIHYDTPVLAYICLHYNELLNYQAEQIADKIHDFSSSIINSDFIEKEYKYYFKKWIPVDVYLHWSRMLRLSKKISLKSLGIQINYPVVQELPYPPGSYLNELQIEEVKNYNYVHDLGIMDKLLTHPIYLQGKPTTIEKEIELRAAIKKDYKTSHYIYSWDAPKIASELLLVFKAEKEGKQSWELKQELKNNYKEYAKPLELQNLHFKLPVFQKLFETFKEVNRTNNRNFSENIILLHGDTRLKISYGLGGIHNIMSNEIYESSDSHVVKTSDANSLYPNLLINYKCIEDVFILKLYEQIKFERMIAKREGNKNKDAAYKLILNSVSGLIDSTFSWLYYPPGAIKMRLMGQLIMTKVVEELVINNFRVISVNTDGIEAIVPIVREKEYYEIVNTIGRDLNLEFEHDDYAKIVYSNVNAYVAITKYGGIKQKGSAFITNPNLGDSCNKLIVSKALVAYFSKGTKPEDFINNHTDIFDFCLSMKCDKSYTVYWGGKKQQRLNRFYVSKKGKYLYKSKDQKKMTNMLKDNPVIIYNNHIEKDMKEYEIDYSYYISETKSIISEIERHNQLTLF